MFKIIVVCSECGKELMSIINTDASERRLKELEKICACNEHGGNEYEWNEELQEEVLVGRQKIKAIRLKQ